MVASTSVLSCRVSDGTTTHRRHLELVNLDFPSRSLLNVARLRSTLKPHLESARLEAFGVFGSEYCPVIDSNSQH